MTEEELREVIHDAELEWRKLKPTPEGPSKSLHVAKAVLKALEERHES